MKTFTVETILIEDDADEQDALDHFSNRAQQMGFSMLEIEDGRISRILEWRDYKLVLIDY